MITTILSIRHKKTSRKSMMAGVAVLLLVLSAPGDDVGGCKALRRRAHLRQQKNDRP